MGSEHVWRVVAWIILGIFGTSSEDGIGRSVDVDGVVVAWRSDSGADRRQWRGADDNGEGRLACVAVLIT